MLSRLLGAGYLLGEEFFDEGSEFRAGVDFADDTFFVQQPERGQAGDVELFWERAIPTLTIESLRPADLLALDEGVKAGAVALIAA